jgi:hypothetical protein
VVGFGECSEATDGRKLGFRSYEIFLLTNRRLRSRRLQPTTEMLPPLTSFKGTKPAMATLPTADPSNPASAMELDSSISSLESVSSQKILSGAELIEQVLKMVKNQERAELILLELMEEYSFSFPRLKELLRSTLTTLWS